MFIHPHIDPVAVQLGPLAVHWYGLMYLVGFLGAYGILRYRAPLFAWKKEEVGELLFYGACGVILGGRLGYVLFYGGTFYLTHPLNILKLWDGGMSFHGGLLGVLLAMWVFAWRFSKNYFDVTDFLAPGVPIGLGAGRLGNFINGELWGRVTDMPWGMVYPKLDQLPRHPSELYEFLLEGVLLFLIVWIYSRKRKPRMAVSGCFMLSYGVFRFIAEFFRQPDQQLGFLAGDWLTMGQLLSLPMLIVGLFLLIFAYRRSVV